MSSSGKPAMKNNDIGHGQRLKGQYIGHVFST